MERDSCKVGDDVSTATGVVGSTVKLVDCTISSVEVARTKDVGDGSMMADVWNESERVRVREDGVGVSKNDVVSGTKLEVKNVLVVLGLRLVNSEMLDCTNVVDGVISKMGVED